MADWLAATGKTLEEIDILFARSPEVRERLEARKIQRRGSYGAIDGPLGRRASVVSNEVFVVNEKV